MSKNKILQIGNSLGVTLPNEIVSRLKLKKGDIVYINHDSHQKIIVIEYTSSQDIENQIFEDPELLDILVKKVSRGIR